MKQTTKVIIYIFSIFIVLSCSEQHTYTDKKNLNDILNSLSKGEFYSCKLDNIYKFKNSEQKKIHIKEVRYKINKNINLIHFEEKIGLIYKSDKWNHGNSIFLEDKKIKNSFNMGSFYDENDFNYEIINKQVSLKFYKNILELNLFDQTLKSVYSCIRLEKILSEALKKQLLENFLYQNNSSRI